MTTPTSNLDRTTLRTLLAAERDRQESVRVSAASHPAGSSTRGQRRLATARA
jgi:hypothetical protein